MNASRTDDPLKIGLTGGIASGKSTVANLFADLGVPVIDTDVIARDLVEPGQPALDEIRRQFGDALIDETGHLDRVAMRKLIFADDEARSSLEAILHPRIGAEARRQSKEANGPYQIIVIPLLVQSPLLEFIDRVLVVESVLPSPMTSSSITTRLPRRALPSVSSIVSTVASLLSKVLHNGGPEFVDIWHGDFL